MLTLQTNMLPIIQVYVPRSG